MRLWTLLILLLSNHCLAKHNIGIFISPLSLISGGRGGIEAYLGKHFALGAEYSNQNTVIDDTSPYDPYRFLCQLVKAAIPI